MCWNNSVLADGPSVIRRLVGNQNWLCPPQLSYLIVPNRATNVVVIIQVLPMRLLRCALVRTQIEITGGNEAIMAQDVLDMANGTAIEEERRRHRVAQHVRGDRFGKADHFSKTPEPGERRAKSHRLTPPAHDKERLSLVVALHHIL